ncbi:MAG: hypothetical protein AAF772_02520 [Acidobacteriota bacterium]
MARTRFLPLFLLVVVLAVVTATLAVGEPPQYENPFKDLLFVAQGVAALGEHRYDGSGNVRARGSEWYGFDGANRLRSYNLGSGSKQEYRFDGFGNLNRITTDGVHRTLPILTASNRLMAESYDAAGNLTAWAGETYGFDVLYRDGMLLASRVRFGDGTIGVRDYVVDHLGTPRLIGDRFDGLRTQHFFGFGEPTDLTASLGDPERKRFTGHERDLGTLGGAGGIQIELDYMRARFHSPWTARFLSVDPARESVNPQRPQT